MAKGLMKESIVGVAIKKIQVSNRPNKVAWLKDRSSKFTGEPKSHVSLSFLFILVYFV